MPLVEHLDLLRDLQGSDYANSAAEVRSAGAIPAFVQKWQAIRLAAVKALPLLNKRRTPEEEESYVALMRKIVASVGLSFEDRLSSCYGMAAGAMSFESRMCVLLQVRLSI